MSSRLRAHIAPPPAPPQKPSGLIFAIGYLGTLSRMEPGYETSLLQGVRGILGVERTLVLVAGEQSIETLQNFLPEHPMVEGIAEMMGQGRLRCTPEDKASALCQDTLPRLVLLDRQGHMAWGVFLRLQRMMHLPQMDARRHTVRYSGKCQPPENVVKEVDLLVRQPEFI